MPTDDPHGNRVRRVEEALSAFLDRIEAGDDVDIETFCSERPEFAEALDALQRDLGPGHRPFRELLGEHLGMEAASELFRDDDPRQDDSETARAVPPGRRTSRRFSFRGEIARGGMGVVLRLRDGDLNRELAMKVLRTDPGAGSTRGREQTLRFIQEAQITAQLEHPGIVPVHEVGFDDAGRLYFTMRLVEGSDLDSVFKRVRDPEDGWNLSRAVGAILKVCQAVAYAHAKGVVHRDLKPGNVMVGRFGEVYVMDWGLAKVRGSSDLHDLRPQDAPDSREHSGPRHETDDPVVTMDGTVIGTASYMSPEQACGEIDAVDERSDVYSIGAMLYTLLTGSVPYVEAGETPSSHAILGRVVHGPPRPARELDPDAPPELVAICEKAMARSTSERYSSCMELAEDLQAWVEGRVVRAYETGIRAELRKWITRNRGLAASIAASVVLVVGALLLITVLQAISNRRLGEANLVAERQVVELNETLGIVADEREDPAEAILSFANAARHARHDPRRARLDALRVETWRRAICEPVRALPHLGEEIKELAFHPSGRYLMVLSWGARCAIWNLREEERLALPTEEGIAFAAWSPDGDEVALALRGGLVQCFGFPDWSERASVELPDTVVSLAYAPDGHFLALGGDDLRVWAPRTGTLLEAGRTESTPVNRVAFDRRGALVAACAENAQIFSITPDGLVPGLGPLPASTPDRKHRPLVPLFVADHDGSGEGDGLIIQRSRVQLARWDLASGTLDRTIQCPSPLENVSTSALSPDGRYLAVGGYGGICVKDLASSGVDGPTLAIKQIVHSLDFSPDGGILASGSEDNIVRLWDVRDGSLAAPPIPHSRPVTLVAFAPDGRHLASAQADGLVRLWRLPPRSRGRLVELPIRQCLLAVSPDGHFVLPASWNLQRSFVATRAYDVSTGEAAGAELAAGGFINGAAFSPDSRHAVTLSAARGVGSYEGWPDVALHVDPGRVTVWDWRSGGRVGEVIETESEPVGCDYSSSGARLAVVCAGGDLLLLDANQPRVIRRRRLPGRFQPGLLARKLVRFTPDGQSLVVWGLDDRVHVLDAATLESRYPPCQAHTLCRLVAFSPGGDRQVESWSDGRAIVRDIATGKEAATPLGHSDELFAARFSPDGRLVATAGRGGKATIWDWRTGEIVSPPLEHEDEVFDVRFAASGNVVVTASRDATVRVWDAVFGKPLAPSLHVRSFAYQAIVADGGRLVVAGLLRGFRLFDVDALGERNRQPQEPDPYGESLRRRAEVLSGRRVSEGGGVVNLDTAAWLERWRALRESGAIGNSLEGPAEEALEFHRGACETSRLSRAWSPAIWHATRCLELRPTDTTLLATRGALRLRIGHWDDADRDLSRAIELGARDWRYWFDRATARALSSGLETAASDCRAVIERLGDDATGNPDLCAAALVARDRVAYQGACRRALEQSATIRGESVANRVAWCFAMGPDAVEDYEPVLRLARLAVARRPGNSNYINTLGGVLYRAGRLSEAVEALEQNVEESDAKGGALTGSPFDWLFLAMARNRLGDVEGARALLGATRAWRADASASPAEARLYPTLRLRPDHWLELLVLEREATMLLEGRSG